MLNKEIDASQLKVVDADMGKWLPMLGEHAANTTSILLRPDDTGGRLGVLALNQELSIMYFPRIGKTGEVRIFISTEDGGDMPASSLMAIVREFLDSLEA